MAPDPGPLPVDLAQRTVVVTGAARGIGLTITQRLLRCRSRVIAIDKDGDALHTMLGGDRSCRCIVEDLAECDLAQLAKDILHQDPDVQLIVHNAGMTTRHGFSELDERSFDAVHRTNLRTPLFLTKYLLRPLLEGASTTRHAVPRTGSVVLISSLHDSHNSGRPQYSTSKAALTMLASELAEELGPFGIRVNVISPGAIRTHPEPDTPEQVAKYQRLIPRIPLRRAGSPEDVARLAVILLSDSHSGYLTGETIRLDGGLSLPSWASPPEARRAGWQDT
ncbi:MAG TPA: SDR family oxidoreductase [Actinomycetes bacterium]|nr:SDR family oxidoreductase [Actinomycetes bacterium]